MPRSKKDELIKPIAPVKGRVYAVFYEGRPLTTAEISELASRPDVDGSAVRNFFENMVVPMGGGRNLYNAHQDQREQKWNKATLNAVRDGIYKIYKVEFRK